MELDYDNYYGHNIEILKKLVNDKNKYIYLVGDSVLDNKYWVKNIKTEKVRDIFTVPDIAYHINSLLDKDKSKDLNKKDYICINCAVEESKIESKNILNEHEALNEQDKFVRDNIKDDDILVVSLGGNDIMLSFKNILPLIKVLISSNYKDSENYKNLLNIFNLGIENYVKKILGKHQSKVIVLFPYFPCEVYSESWGNFLLTGMMLFKHKIKKLMKDIFEDITYPYIKIPLYEIFDSTKEEDYVQRLEPSYTGGLKIAKEIVKHI
jgi:hypothetical protein